MASHEAKIAAAARARTAAIKAAAAAGRASALGIDDRTTIVIASPSAVVRLRATLGTLSISIVLRRLFMHGETQVDLATFIRRITAQVAPAFAEPIALTVIFNAICAADRSAEKRSAFGGRQGAGAGSDGGPQLITRHVAIAALASLCTASIRDVVEATYSG